MKKNRRCGVLSNGTSFERGRGRKKVINCIFSWLSVMGAFVFSIQMNITIFEQKLERIERILAKAGKSFSNQHQQSQKTLLAVRQVILQLSGLLIWRKTMIKRFRK